MKPKINSLDELTVFTIDSKYLESLLEDAEGFRDVLNYHLRVSDNTNTSWMKGLKLFNPHSPQSNALYLQHEGKLVEMSPYSKETRQLLKKDPDYFNKAITVLEHYLSSLKRIKSGFEPRTI